MTENTGYAAYALYWGLKLHFEGNYDYFKYNGKTKVSKDTFEKSKVKFHFYKLSRKYTFDELKDFYVANFLHRDIRIPQNLLNVESEECYKKWQKTNQSLTYTFEQDIMHLFELVNSPEELLKVNGDYPLLLQKAMQEDIAIETLCIMNDLMGFFAMWTKNISDTVIWPDYEKKCIKYTPFILYDKNKFRNILKEGIREHALQN